MSGKDRLKTGGQGVDVWFVDLATWAGRTPDATLCLSVEERARAARFVHRRDAERYEAAHGWLRAVLGAYLGCAPAEVPIDGRGKPRLATSDSGLEFNLTHAGGWAACAVSLECPVGIDLERARPLDDLEEMAASIFSPEDLARYRSLPSALRLPAFYRAWTRKEACLKATGQGLGLAPARVSVTFEAADSAALQSYDGRYCGHDWTLAGIDVPPGWAAAVAAPRAAVEIRTVVGMVIPDEATAISPVAFDH